eukprot:TRINITY_DN315_c0_g1_i4.p1 TRINITY_DN315_c0_g1~~TRINITY_DN315_c0_g1_i4.p1  ORF type:complete len:254 (-),score=18.42 TRINITY_DN315_c0_g1_i4:238-999(-)
MMRLLSLVLLLFVCGALSENLHHCVVTPAETDHDVQGPFFLADAPFRTDLCSTGCPQNTPITISGFVMDSDCMHIPNALIEIWAADTSGEYQTEASGWYRGKLNSGSDGSFSFSTTQPGKYPLGEGFRPAHIHAMIFVRDVKRLTTQIYFEGDPYLGANDACGSGCGSSHSSLIMSLVNCTTDDSCDGQRGEFNFVLATSEQPAPTPTPSPTLSPSPSPSPIAGAGSSSASWHHSPVFSTMVFISTICLVLYE